MWINVASKFIQYLEIEKSTFERIWKVSQNPDDMVRLAVLQQFEISQRLFLFSQLNIIYEYGKKQTFKPGDVIMPLHRRSIF